MLGRVKSYSKANKPCRNCTACQTNRATAQGFLTTSNEDREYQLLTQGEDNAQREKLAMAWEKEISGQKRNKRRGEWWDSAAEVEFETGE